MRIFNENKTKELDKKEIDLSLGHLQPDVLTVTIPAQKGKTIQEVVEEKKLKGASIEVVNGESYEVLWNGEAFGGGKGKSLQKILPIPDIPEQVKKEEIQVYILYTQKEIEERKMADKRAKRASLLSAFDVWEKAVLRGRETDSAEVMAWYTNLLNLDDVAFANIPTQIKKYL